jgi:hypothetical protein
MASFSIDHHKARTGRVTWDDLDLTAFGTDRLPEGALRCLRSMHDVEHHTICYLREVLVTPAHRDPELTTFLILWAFEELWHGEALAAVLDAHGEPAGTARVAASRANLGARDHLRPLLIGLAGWAAGDDFVAVHMAWGAVNELATRAGYARLVERAGHPVLTELVSRILRQEGRHAAFYLAQAHRRLEASRRARCLTRAALRHLWQPVGSGVMASAEAAFLVDYLFGGADGRRAADRVDRQLDRLPGLCGLGLLRGAVDARTTARPAVGEASSSRR